MNKIKRDVLTDERKQSDKHGILHNRLGASRPVELRDLSIIERVL